MRSPNCSVLSYHTLHPLIPDSVFLACGARVIGDVELGENVSVWFNAVVRGDVSKVTVGVRTNIQDGAVLHGLYQRFSVTVGSDVSVGHLAMIHGCIVEDKCLIGMHATVLDGAVVGAGSVVGAGALVPPGLKIPERSLVVGVPGKVVRRLEDSEIESFFNTTQRYMEYTKGYPF